MPMVTMLTTIRIFMLFIYFSSVQGTFSGSSLGPSFMREPNKVGYVLWLHSASCQIYTWFSLIIDITQVYAGHYYIQLLALLRYHPDRPVTLHAASKYYSQEPRTDIPNFNWFWLFYYNFFQLIRWWLLWWGSSSGKCAV